MQGLYDDPTFVISHYNIQMRNLKKSVNNVAEIIKITNIGKYGYMGAIRRRGPAETIFCHRMQYPFRTSNTKFETILVNNVAKVIKIPNIESYRHLEAIPKCRPTWPIFSTKSPADIVHIRVKFYQPISFRPEARVISTDGQTD